MTTTNETAPEKTGGKIFNPVDLSDHNSLPDLSTAKEIDVDLLSDYWTPENIGETKRVFFVGIETRTKIDKETGEVEELDHVIFFEKTEEGIKTITNASAVLVQAFSTGTIPQGTPVSIQYIGKKKNKNNAFQHDAWRVKPLVLEIKTK